MRAEPPSRAVHAPPASPVAGGAPGPSSPAGDGPGPSTGAAALHVAAAPAPGRTWEIAFPAGLELLSLNGREHHMARYRKSRALKDATIVLCRAAKVPALGRISVTVFYDPPDRRKRDHDNLWLTAKSLTDGLVKADVVVNDTPEYVVPGRCEVTETVHPGGRLRMVITELAP